MLTVNRKQLLNALDSVKAGFTGRSSLPILLNVLVQTNETGYTLTGTDLELSVVRSVSQDFIEQVESFTVVYATLRKLVNDFSGEEVSFKSTKEGMKVSSAKSTYNLLTLPGEDYPKLPTVEDKLSFFADSAALKQVLSRAIVCVSQDENRAILTGVLFEFNLDEEKITVASTDTHRLCVQKMSTASPDWKSSVVMKVIVPSKCVNELLKMLPNEPEGAPHLEVTLNENHIRFTYNDVTLTSKLISGQFPNYSRVIPQDSAGKVVWTVNVAELTSAIKRASTVAKENSNRIVFAGNKEGLLTIRADSQMVGSGVEELDYLVDGVFYDTETEFQVAFNAQYFLQALGSLTAPSFYMTMSDPLKPGIIRVSGDLDYLHVLMPMQVV